MRTKPSGRLLYVVIAIALGASAVGCAESPVRPTAGQAIGAPAAAGSPAATTFAETQSTASLARCLSGTGDAACFGARALRAATLSVSPATAPGAPSNLMCSVSGSTVALSWLASVGGDPVTTYRLQAGSRPGLFNYADFMTLSTVTTYHAFDVLPGSYYVRVLGMNAANQSSSPSNEVLVVVGGNNSECTQTTVPVCPTAPRSLLNASQSAGTISLTWSAPASGTPTSYVITAGSAPGLSDLANFDTGNTALSYLATDVPAGSYHVRVYAKSSCGLSSASNEVLVFVVGFTSDVQVSVSWDAPTDVDLHVVEPSGNEIYYGNATSATGGQLDVDSNPACSIDGRQIENIRWASGAPVGTYTVRVDYWDSCGVAQTNYLVTVKNGGSTQTFSGSFTGDGDRGGSGSGRTITTFTHAASLMLDSVLHLVRPPLLFAPSPEKLKLSGGSR